MPWQPERAALQKMRAALKQPEETERAGQQGCQEKTLLPLLLLLLWRHLPHLLLLPYLLGSGLQLQERA